MIRYRWVVGTFCMGFLLLSFYSWRHEKGVVTQSAETMVTTPVVIRTFCRPEEMVGMFRLTATPTYQGLYGGSLPGIAKSHDGDPGVCTLMGVTSVITEGPRGPINWDPSMVTAERDTIGPRNRTR